MMQFKNLTYSFFAIVLAVFTTSALSAQDGNPPREVGIQFSSLDFDGGGGFSAFFKKQKKENVYRRIRFFYGNISVGEQREEFQFDVSTGIAIGREKRKMLDSKLEFYQGPEFALRLDVSSFLETQSQISVTPSFGWVLGLQHSFNERWAVNLETIPGASISFYANTNDEDSRSLNFNAGLKNAVLIGLVRKF